MLAPRLQRHLHGAEITLLAIEVILSWNLDSMVQDICNKLFTTD